MPTVLPVVHAQLRSKRSGRHAEILPLQRWPRRGFIWNYAAKIVAGVERLHRQYGAFGGRLARRIETQRTRGVLDADFAARAIALRGAAGVSDRAAGEMGSGSVRQ